MPVRNTWKKRHTRGKIFLCKLPYTTNNGCYANHVQHVSKTWGRFQSNISQVSNSTEKNWNVYAQKYFYFTSYALCTSHPVSKGKCLQYHFFSHCQIHEVVQWLDGWESLIWSRHLIWLCFITYQKWLYQCKMILCTPRSKKYIYVTPICILIVMFPYPFSGSRYICYDLMILKSFCK